MGSSGRRTFTSHLPQLKRRGRRLGLRPRGVYRWQVDGAIGPHTLLQSIWLAGERAGQASAASTPSSTSSVAGTDDHERGLRSSQAGNALS